MSTEAASLSRPLRPARPRWRRLPLEHLVMGGAVAALVILVVLPLMSLLFGSLRGEDGLSLEHFAEVLTGRLYVTAPENLLLRGAGTGLFFTIIGPTMAGGKSHTDVPAKPLLQLTATL